ncbi:MAG TPA: hypothetical protein VKX25_02845 [Bryobacteraceae bacterium]|jgi:hypothetical protein|nr:hypothetical protein [Bryobacteraceae bacterium]
MAEQATHNKEHMSDMKNLIREAIEEFMQAERGRSEPAYRAELQEERKRRESLESRLNQMAEENRQARAAAEEAERHAQIRSELQRAGVAKLELAFRAIKDEIVRGEDGRLQSRDSKPLPEYVSSFVQENPELMPARISGGSGGQKPMRSGYHEENHSIVLDQIRPGMNKEDLDRARQHIAKLAWQALRGA